MIGRNKQARFLHHSTSVRLASFISHSDRLTLKAILCLVLSAYETPNKSQDVENSQKVFFTVSFGCIITGSSYYTHTAFPPLSLQK